MTHPFSWERPPSYWPDTEYDYEPQGEPCSTCQRNTEAGRRWWCPVCLALTCESCQDREQCAVCQRLHDDERDYAEVDGQFGIGLLNPCPFLLCNREGPHRHRVTIRLEGV